MGSYLAYAARAYAGVKLNALANMFFTDASNFAIKSLLTYKRGQRTRFPNFQRTIEA